MELAIWASFILQFRVRTRAGGGDDLRGGNIATENARLSATGPIDLLDTESAIAVRDDLAASNAQFLDRSVKPEGTVIQFSRRPILEGEEETPVGKSCLTSQTQRPAVGIR